MFLELPDRPNWRRVTLASEDVVDELKFWSDFRNATNLTAFTALFDMLPEVERGTAENQRIGNQISVNWIFVGWTINTRNEAIASPSDGVVRHMIFVDYQSNGTAPLLPEIIDTTIGYLTGPYNRDYVPRRYQILHDEIITVKTGNVTYGGGVPVYSNGLGYKSDKVCLLGGPVDVRYNSGNSPTTASDVNTGNIWNMFLSEVANVRVQPTFRIHYLDQ